MIAAIKKAGGNPKYTEYPGVGHNSLGQGLRHRRAVQVAAGAEEEVSQFRFQLATAMRAGRTVSQSSIASEIDNPHSGDPIPLESTMSKS